MDKSILQPLQIKTIKLKHIKSQFTGNIITKESETTTLIPNINSRINFQLILKLFLKIS